MWDCQECPLAGVILMDLDSLTSFLLQGVVDFSLCRCEHELFTRSFLGGSHPLRVWPTAEQLIRNPSPMRRVIYGSGVGTRTTVSNGYLGSRNDEERSEMRYVMRIAEFSESSNL